MPPSQSAIDELLAKLSGEGRGGESGRFSLDPRARLEKMARYQSDEPALYLLKAVQAAVNLGATGVDIRLARGYVEVAFDHNSPARLEEQLRVGHVSSMVLAAVSLQSSELSLQWWGTGGGQIWTPEAGLQELDFLQKPGFVLRISRDSISFWERYLPVPQLASVQATLNRRCQFCPIPVRLDGRVINLGVPAGPVGPLEKVVLDEEGPHFCLADFNRRRTRCVFSQLGRHPLEGQFEGRPAIRMSLLEGLPPDCCLRERDRNINKNYEPDPRELWLGMTAKDHLVLHRPNHREKRSYLKVRAWISLPSVPDSRFRLVYILDGVALDEVVVDGSWPGAQCLLVSDSVNTDLGQLRPLQDETVRQDCDWVAQQVAEILKVAHVSQNQKADPYAGVDYQDPTYEPTPDALWNHSFSLSQSLLQDECILGRACELFQLPPRFTEEVKLRLDRQEKVLWVIGGGQSKVRRQPLAALEELTSVHLQWIEYMHERDWPAQDEPALQIELTLTFVANTLTFKAGGYSKFGPPGEYDQFCSWCTRLAQEFGASLSTRRGNKPIW